MFQAHLTTVFHATRRSSSAKTTVVSELKLTPLSKFRVEMVRVHCLQNEDSVENTRGTTNYSFSLFFIKNAFV